MRIKVPFHYSVGYIPFRAQNTRTAYFASETEVEIREVEAARAPVALTLARRAQAYGSRFLPTRDGRPRQMLWFEGKLWIENGPAEDFKRTIENGDDPKDTPFSPCNHRRSAKDRRAELNNPITDIRSVEAANPRLRSIDDDGGKRMAEKLARRAEDVIIVDGVVYEREYEPCLQVEVERGRIKATLSSERSHSNDPFDSDYRSVLRSEHSQWNLLQLEEAVDFERRRAGEDLPVDVQFDLEILMPEVAVYAAHADAILSLAGSALKDLTQAASGLTPDAAAAMFELRDALAQTGDDVTLRLIAALRMVADLPEADDAEVQRLRALAAVRPGKQERTWGPVEKSRPEQAVEAACKGVPQARENALTALGRMDCRLPGISWEDEGLKEASFYDGRLVSREILSLDAAKRLGASLGVDLSELAESARSGEGRLMVVADRGSDYTASYYESDTAIAAVLVSTETNDVLAALGKSGAEPPSEVVAVAAAHARCGSHSLEQSEPRLAAAV